MLILSRGNYPFLQPPRWKNSEAQFKYFTFSIRRFMHFRRLISQFRKNECILYYFTTRENPAAPEFGSCRAWPKLSTLQFPLPAQAIKTTNNPRPRAKIQSANLPLISPTEFPILAGVGVGVATAVPVPVPAPVGLEVAVPDAAPDPVVLALPVPLPLVVGAEVDGVEADAEDVDLALAGVVVELETTLELEETEPAATTFPPDALPAEEEEEVPAAAALYAASESPDAGGLTTPAMPPWQWVGVPQKNQMGSVFLTVTWKTSDYQGVRALVIMSDWKN
jgi:hypothetical protein